MCGIGGVWQLDGGMIEREILGRMVKALHHRGPDASGIHLAGPIGLGHTRLKIIDLSDSARQPMCNEDETIWIVFNGEIYNFREIRADLERKGYRFRSHSDTEVILRLYEEIGDKCVDALEGMFAFAIWDGRRRRLVLARDRAGKKPLFYGGKQGAFVFGSEVKALLKHPAVTGQVALDALPHYFTFGYAPPGRTLYEGINQVPPAHVLMLEADGRMELRRYWDLDFAPRAGKPPSVQAAAEQVRGLVTDAVRKRLVSDVPLGAFLSGGIDSTIVVGIMSRLMDQPVKTFSLGFAGDPDFDETYYARLASSHFRTEHTEFIVEPKAVDLIETLVWHHDGPFGDSSAIPSYIVSQLTRQHVTVALNGDGGDELFAGYLRFQATVAAERIPPAVSRACHHALSVFPQPKQYHHWFRRAQRFFAGASSSLFGRMRRWISIFDEDVITLLRPEMFKGLPTGIVDYPPELIARTGSFSPLSKALYVNFMTYLPDDLLVKMDRSSMAHGLEGRSPFLDHRLAEYVAGLPDAYKLHGTTTKYILKKAFADMLPEEILRRGKKGFGVPLGAWFRGDLRDYVQDLLLSPTAHSRDYVVPSYVAELVREHLSGVRDHGHRLWTLMTFEVWLRLMQQDTPGASA